VHHRDHVGHRHGLDLVVGDVDRGRADPVVQAPELLAHQLAEGGIERAERLVHQERARAAHDRAAERHALAVAAGEARDRLVEQMVDPQQARGLLDPLPDLGPRHALRAQRVGHVAPHVQVRVEREQLEDEGDVALGRAQRRDVRAVEPDRARGRQFQPGDHPQRRGLAAAGRPEQDEELAVLDRQVDPLDRDEVGERLVQALEADLSHWASPGRSRGSG
jgi:hypothetical protein